MENGGGRGGSSQGRMERNGWKERKAKDINELRSIPGHTQTRQGSCGFMYGFEISRRCRVNRSLYLDDEVRAGGCWDFEIGW